MTANPFSRFPISKRLPLLIVGLLLTGTIIFGWISYAGVKSAALKVGEDRLLALTEQLSELYPVTTPAYVVSTRAVAQEQVIKRFVQSNDEDSIPEVKRSLQKLRADTLFVQVDLLNAERKVIFRSAKDGGKLSDAFNAMAMQVEHSQIALERKALEYKFLFEKKTMPMWVLSRATLDIIAVNDAAVGQYGYSREEFLQLNAIELWPTEDVEKYLAHAKQPNEKSHFGCMAA